MLNIPGSNQLSSFLALYKREHKITRQKECLEVVMERYFPSEVAGTGDSIEFLDETPGGEGTDTAEQAPASTTARGAGSSASTSKTPHVPPKSKSTTPAAAVEPSQLQGNNTASEKISLGNLLLDKTDFVSALSLLEKDKKHKALVDALKATTSNLTPSSDGAQAPPTTKAVVIPGSVSTAQSKTPQSTPRGSHTTTKTAISLCLHPNDKSVVFSRKPTQDEFEDDWTIEFLKRELCERIAACDSIRSLSADEATDSTIYSKPPKFTQQQSAARSASEDTVETLIAPKKILFSPETKAGASTDGVPIVSFRDRSDNVRAALSKLKTAIDYCFIKPQAIYVTQSSFNDKSAKMENKGQKSALEKKANETLKIYSQHSGPAGKLNEEVTRKRKKDEAVALQQKIQSLTDQLAVSESKRLKAEAKAKNIQGGPREGAHSTNQSHPPTPSMLHMSPTRHVVGGHPCRVFLTCHMTCRTCRRMSPRHVAMSRLLKLPRRHDMSRHHVIEATY
jgi:hypothetical protein